MNYFDELSEALIRFDIKPSVHRIRILEYLLKYREHPTAERIYDELKQQIHSLTRATVYNTLALFSEKNIVRALTFDESERIYDITTQSHGHFVCAHCRSIYDFDFNMDGCAINDLSDFRVTDNHVYLKGVCARCLLNTPQNKETDAWTK